MPWAVMVARDDIEHALVLLASARLIRRRRRRTAGKPVERIEVIDLRPDVTSRHKREKRPKPLEGLTFVA